MYHRCAFRQTRHRHMLLNHLWPFQPFQMRRPFLIASLKCSRLATPFSAITSVVVCRSFLTSSCRLIPTGSAFATPNVSRTFHFSRNARFTSVPCFTFSRRLISISGIPPSASARITSQSYFGARPIIPSAAYALQLPLCNPCNPVCNFDPSFLAIPRLSHPERCEISWHSGTFGRPLGDLRHCEFFCETAQVRAAGSARGCTMSV